MSDSAFETSDIAFETEDGFPLRGTLLSGSGRGPAVLISSAAAVPDGFYRHFAGRLIEQGASRVLSYDYRGVARSVTPRRWKARLNMKDWGVLDMPAALDTLKRHAKGTSVVGIGHSFGGVALGLSNRSQDFQRYVTLASLSGYYRNTAEPLTVFARMNLLGVPLTLPFGRLPKWSGIGEALPGTVFRDWARWCRNPTFLFEDPKVPEARYFPAVRTPVLGIGITDDPWGTPRAVDLFLARLSNARISQLWLSPEKPLAEPIGHLGFFRKQRAQTLWPPVIDWLLHDRMPEAATPRRQAQAA
ncbi:MAG: alpha/beta hydrolase family protein [Phyllobacterium sp.]